MLRKDRPLVAVVGLGYWGRNLMRDFYRLGAIKSVWDANADLVRQRLAEHPGPEAAPDFEAILQDEAISGVVLATPAATHFPLGQRVLAAGKHLFVEKPLALAWPEGRELVNLAKNKRLVLMVDHLLQNHPAYVKLRELAEAGHLGRIRRIVSRRQSFGKLRTEEDVWWSFAPHDISMILGLMGRPPESVALSGDAWISPGLVDAAEAQLDFGGGATAHISISWLHPTKEHRLIVVGEEKMAVFDDTLPWEEKLRLYPHRVTWPHQRPTAEPGPAESVPLAEAQPLKAQARDFLSAMAGEKAPLTDGDEGLAVLSVLAAGSESLKNGGRPQAPAGFAPDYFVHPTAIVEPGVKIGAGCKIWHFSHLLEGVELGENCSLGQNVVVGPRVRVGRGVKIQNNVSVYEGVTLEDEVFCGPSMVFTNVINPRSDIVRKDEYRATRVKRGASIGANATIVCGHDLGAWCFIGAGAVVTTDVPDQALMVGSPARQRGWVCRCGHRLPEDLACGQCGRGYEPGPEGLRLLGENV